MSIHEVKKSFICLIRFLMFCISTINTFGVYTGLVHWTALAPNGLFRYDWYAHVSYYADDEIRVKNVAVAGQIEIKSNLQFSNCQESTLSLSFNQNSVMIYSFFFFFFIFFLCIYLYYVCFSCEGLSTPASHLTNRGRPVSETDGSYA